MFKKNKKIPKRPKKFIDSDQDGLSDWEEKNILGSDPYDADTDGDGIEDGEAVLKGRHPVTGQKLKDFFIPHEGNNYSPKSLHPKRILFHVTTAVAIKLVVVFFIILYPLSAWMTPDVAAIQSKKIISLTNDLRKDLALSVLVENNKLNQAAYAKVQDMFLEQYFAHTSPDNKNLENFFRQVGYDYSISGENLAMGFDNPEEVLMAWEKSPSHYANLVDENFQEIGVSLAEDVFKGGNTVFIAQYFARPKTVTAAVNSVVKEAEVETPNIETNSDSKVVLAARESEVVLENIAKTEIIETDGELIEKEIPVNDLENDVASTTVSNVNIVNSVIVDSPVGQDESLVKVEVNISQEVKEASAMVLNNNIPLVKNKEGNWEGQRVVYNKDSGPMVPASLTITDSSGNKNISELAVEDIKTQETSKIKQYTLLRDYPNSTMANIFDISSIYFKLILIFAIISLAFNIFIKIKKQNIKSIISGITLISLLIVLIII